jgi:hypothetical protein
MRVHLPDLNHDLMHPAPARHVMWINSHFAVTLLPAFPALASQWQGAHTRAPRPAGPVRAAPRSNQWIFNLNRQLIGKHA